MVWAMRASRNRYRDTTHGDMEEIDVALRWAEFGKAASQIDGAGYKPVVEPTSVAALVLSRKT